MSFATVLSVPGKGGLRRWGKIVMRNAGHGSWQCKMPTLRSKIPSPPWPPSGWHFQEGIRVQLVSKMPWAGLLHRGAQSASGLALPRRPRALVPTSPLVLNPALTRQADPLPGSTQFGACRPEEGSMLPVLTPGPVAARGPAAPGRVRRPRDPDGLLLLLVVRMGSHQNA